EIKVYCAENVVPKTTDIIDWWKCNVTRFPILAAVARQYLAIPATQVSSERLFSDAGNIVTATRSKLIPENVEKLCFLHFNLK
ncbi:Zinc finger BED domain-containing protein 1, partial [Cyphomyrmex costatus]